MEDKQRYHFLKTTFSDKEQAWMAVIADAVVLGDNGLNSVRNSFNANAKAVSRGGVHIMTQDQLEQRVAELENAGMDKSLEAYKRAIICIKVKKGEPIREGKVAPSSIAHG